MNFYFDHVILILWIFEQLQAIYQIFYIQKLTHPSKNKMQSELSSNLLLKSINFWFFFSTLEIFNSVLLGRFLQNKCEGNVHVSSQNSYGLKGGKHVIHHQSDFVTNFTVFMFLPPLIFFLTEHMSNLTFIKSQLKICQKFKISLDLTWKQKSPSTSVLIGRLPLN
jgi:hypothetical protein